MTALELARPEAWPLLLLAPLFWMVAIWADRRRRRRLERVLGRRARELAEAPPAPRRRGDRLLAAGGLLGVAVALMDPVGEPVPGHTIRPGMDVMVCLDVSRSMLARDLDPSRLERAKAEVAALCERLRGERMGLVVFAGEARLMAPVTRDLRSLREILAEASPWSVARGGTDLAAGLEVAERALEDARSRAAAVLLLTDGEDHEGRGARAAARCAARGHAVHCVALGTPLGAKIPIPDGAGGETFLTDEAGVEVISRADTATLRAVAAAGGGRYAQAHHRRGVLAALYESHLADPRHATRRLGETMERARYSSVFLGIALGCWLWWFARQGRLPTRRGSRAPVLAAASLMPWILSSGGDPVREGMRAYREGRFEEAARAFAAAEQALGEAAGPELVFDRALAAWRAGSFAEAESAAEMAAIRGGASFAARRDFLLGLAAFGRALRARAEAELPGADPSAWQRAMRACREAVAHWARATVRRGEWPAARRNAERALRELERLRRLAERAAERRLSRPRAQEVETRRPVGADAGTRRRPLDREARPEQEPGAVSEEEIVRLLARLAEREREKRRLRAELRRAASAGVEKDW